MDAYSFNPDTQVYTGVVQCQRDPIKGGWLLPAHSVFLPPTLPIPEGKQARWLGYEWITEDIPEPPPVYLSKIAVLAKIKESVTDDAQLKRLMMASLYAAFSDSLEDYSYDLSRSLLADSLESEDITQDDYDLVLGIIDEIDPLSP